MEIYQSENKTIVFMVLSDKAHIMMGYYKTAKTGQLTVSFEMDNEQAVRLIRQNQHKASEKEKVQMLSKLLRDMAKMSQRHGIDAPGLNELNSHFNKL